MITPELLTYVMGGKISPEVASKAAEKLDWAAKKYDINTPLRVAHFVAQLAHESGFHPKEENLTYRTPSRLCAVFPSRFPNQRAALPYINNPQALANLCYSGKLGNGDVASGDGWRYRGRGMIQLTGKDNYRKYGEMIGYDLIKNPDLANQYGISALVAGAYWKLNNINAHADYDAHDQVTRMVNGPKKEGLRERWKYLQRAKQFLGIK